jgi:hypothetical protein
LAERTSQAQYSTPVAYTLTHNNADSDVLDALDVPPPPDFSPSAEEAQYGVPHATEAQDPLVASRSSVGSVGSALSGRLSGRLSYSELMRKISPRGIRAGETAGQSHEGDVGGGVHSRPKTYSNYVRYDDIYDEQDSDGEANDDIEIPIIEVDLRSPRG